MEITVIQYRAAIKVLATSFITQQMVFFSIDRVTVYLIDWRIEGQTYSPIQDIKVSYP